MGSADSPKRLRGFQGAAMNCFPFFNGAKKEELQATKSTSVQSNSTTSTDCDMRRTSSDITSLNVSDTSADSTGRTLRSQFPSFSQRSSNLRVFTFSELRSATKNFSRSLMVGEGGFGCVYRGTIKNPEDQNTKLEIAVKQLSRKGLQGQKEWLTEVNVLGVVEHPNLVKLVGYCSEDDERGTQRLLVYEYMPNRSVEDHLSSRSTTPLPWPLRLQIARDAARGLTYLHEEMDFQIIFRDFKTSNILLDEHWNAKLSDFGLARQGPAEGLTHVSTAIVGTVGYAAPEYVRTGHLTAKSDIWSYGVVLYELITGRRPVDRNRPKSEQNLLEWVKPYISDVKKFRMILDPRLEGRSSLKPASKLAVVANRCLVRHAKSRPKMSEVLAMVQKIMDDMGTGTPQPSVRIKTPTETDMGTGTPQPSVRIKTPTETATEEGKESVSLKRRIGDSKTGEGKRAGCKEWTRKVVRIC